MEMKGDSAAAPWGGRMQEQRGHHLPVLTWAGHQVDSPAQLALGIVHSYCPTSTAFDCLPTGPCLLSLGRHARFQMQMWGLQATTSWLSVSCLSFHMRCRVLPRPADSWPTVFRFLPSHLGAASAKKMKSQVTWGEVLKRMRGIRSIWHLICPLALFCLTAWNVGCNSWGSSHHFVPWSCHETGNQAPRITSDREDRDWETQTPRVPANVPSWCKAKHCIFCLQHYFQSHLM